MNIASLYRINRHGTYRATILATLDELEKLRSKGWKINFFWRVDEVSYSLGKRDAKQYLLDCPYLDEHQAMQLKLLNESLLNEFHVYVS